MTEEEMNSSCLKHFRSLLIDQRCSVELTIWGGLRIRAVHAWQSIGEFPKEGFDVKASFRTALDEHDALFWGPIFTLFDRHLSFLREICFITY